jgi:hypothetical protein
MQLELTRLGGMVGDMSQHEAQMGFGVKVREFRCADEDVDSSRAFATASRHQQTDSCYRCRQRQPNASYRDNM